MIKHLDFYISEVAEEIANVTQLVIQINLELDRNIFFDIFSKSRMISCGEFKDEKKFKTLFKKEIYFDINDENDYDDCILNLHKLKKFLEADLKTSRKEKEEQLKKRS